MKKYIIIILLFAFLIPLFSTDSGLNLDLGTGISMAFFDPDDLEFGNEEGLLLTLLSIRGGFNSTLRYEITDSLSLGGEIGFYYLSIEGEYDTYTFWDIPMRAVVRFGKDETFIQGFAGYYLPVGSDLGGVEAGAKVALGGIYASASYTLGPVDFLRVEVGYSINDLLR